jgi:hypothetical protein
MPPSSFASEGQDAGVRSNGDVKSKWTIPAVAGNGKCSRIWQDKLHAAAVADESPTAAFTPHPKTIHIRQLSCQIQKGFNPLDF